MRHPSTSERGAILIHVALALVMLVGFSAFVIDHGVMMAGRGQAQNAADAGAMAGAVALAFDDYEDRTDTGAAKQSARTMALQNPIWGQPAVVDMATDVTFPGAPAPCADGACIRVDVYRNQERQNALPTLFGNAFGIESQGVRAMAIARVAIADASDCLKPWAIPDKWLDVHDEDPPIDANTWTADDRFEKYYEKGKNKGTPLPKPDVYVAPSASGPGTGFTVAADLGLQITLKYGNPKQAIRPGFFFPLALPRADDGPSSGGDNYRENIASCNGVPIEIGDWLPVEPGNMIGPTSQGVEALIAQDPDAAWDPVEKRVVNSCAQSNPPCAPRSPRIVAIPIFDVDVYEEGRQGGRTEIKVVNILGFFISSLQGNNVVGYLTTAAGLTTGSSSIDVESSFLKTIVLVR